MYPAVDISHSFHRPSQTQAASSYVIKSLETSSRTIVNHNALDDMTLSEFQTAVTNILTTATPSDKNHPTPNPTPSKIWFHFEGRTPSTTGQCMTWLRHEFASALPPSRYTTADPATVEIAISIELEHPARRGLEQLAAHADVVFYSRSWAEGWGGYGDIPACLRGEAERIRAMHASGTHGEHVDDDDAGRREPARRPGKVTLCCTWGDRGAGMLEMDATPSRESESQSGRTGGEPDTALEARRAVEVVERPAWHPRADTDVQHRIVDTVGAGDTWTAGMLFTFLSRDPVVLGWDLARRVDFANELAGRKILREGFAGLGREMAGQLG